ncbi:hypothetical protein FA13DRAFT_1735295 [Coprinellus micaceus]|uniref:F-box domain-containing protein n=1 Tax=Coprinellus micaceus TaxID=71717 RepID=A0A4Y7T3M3_COPMI|nr:hypothetical protein FA13DRAFT_1735295 [Coprinellus micaceus]
MHFSSFSAKVLRFRSKSQRFSKAPAELPRPPTPHDEPRSHAATLPYEILQIIFAMAMEWRYATQGHSILWVHSIDFRRHPPLAIAHYLHLSRPRLIDVGHRSAPLRISGTVGLTGLTLLKVDCHRVRQWNIDLAPDFQYMDLRYLFCSAENDATSYPVHTLRQTGDIRLPGGCWRRLASSLQKLSLCDTNFMLIPSMGFTNLTELSIISTRASAVKYRATEVVALLRKMHRLHFLCLKNAILVVAGDDAISLSQPLASVNLPNLRLISVSESNWDAAYLLLLLLPILQRSSYCGLDLTLPSVAFHETIATPVHEMTAALRRVRRTIRDAWLSRTMTAPRIEMAFQSRSCEGYRFTMGTIANPKGILDWNGFAGTIGVEQYLDSYFKPSSLRPFEVLHPPLSVTVDNPNPPGLLKTACFLNGDALSTARSVRITIATSRLWPRHTEAVESLIPTALHPLRQVTTMTLDEEASIIVLNTLQDKTYLASGQGPWPVPYLPKLKFIAIESTRPRVGEMGYFGEETRAQTLLIVQEIGYPVEILWAGSTSFFEDREERCARKSKRRAERRE